MTTESERELRPLEVVWRTFEPLLRYLAVGTIAGFFAGAITDAEEVVGVISADGTVFLIFLGGAFGAFGGLVYMGARRWLADAGPWRGLAFGLVLLAMFGWAIIEADNPDFDRFGNHTLNIAMFAALFIIFGALLPPLIDRVERGLPRASLRPSGLGALAAYGFAIVVTLPMIGGIASGSGEEGDNQLFFSLMPVYALLAMPLGAYVLARANGGFERLSDLRGRPTLLAAALALLALPLVVGMVLDALALADIYGADA